MSGATNYNPTGPLVVDTTAPTVGVDIVNASLNDGTPSSTVNFTFSEATTDFTVGDIAVSGGTRSGFTGSGSSYSVLFTATDGLTTTGSVSVAAGNYHDVAGNSGGGNSDTVAIDTENPTVAVNIVATSLSDGTPSSLVTFNFSEATTDFIDGDLTIVGGTLGPITGSGTSYSATFTAARPLLRGWLGDGKRSAATRRRR